jgi:hypothetical protein
MPQRLREIVCRAQGHSHGPVPQKLLDHTDTSSSLEKARRERMPEVVKPYLLSAGPFDSMIECASEVVAIGQVRRLSSIPDNEFMPRYQKTIRGQEGTWRKGKSGMRSHSSVVAVCAVVLVFQAGSINF